MPEQPGSGAVPVPHPKQIRDVLLGLTARDVTLEPGDPVMPGRDRAVVAVYVMERLTTGALVACDLELAACLAGALGLVPPAAVHEAVAAGALTPELAENCFEVANVLGSVFDGAGGPQLALHAVHGADERLPSDLVPLLGHVVRRLDLEVVVSGYGGGRLSVVAVG